MTRSTAMALSLLRLRLNRAFFGFQLVIDLLLPIGYALLIARTESPAAYPRLATAAFILGATLSIMRLPAFVLMMERSFGTRDLLIAAGVTRGDYLFANGIGILYFSVFPVAALCATALALHVVLPLKATYWLALMLYGATMHGVSLIMASLFKEFGLFAMVINLFLLGTVALCPLYYPADRVPHLIAPIVAALPATIAATLANAATRNLGLDTLALAELAAWATASLVAGYWMLPWRQKR